jgi:hypothetical protein
MSADGQSADPIEVLRMASTRGAGVGLTHPLPLVTQHAQEFR